MRGARSTLVAAALLVTAVLPIAGCMTANSYSKARTAIERADVAYGRIRTRADAALPNLPPSAARRVGAGLAIADMALALARATTDPDERETALRRAALAAADIAAALVAAP